MSVRSSEIEAKWQERWYAARINEVENDGRPKFMLIFAYPGVTGYLHVGHMRGFTYVDAIARFKRLEGYNVMFPVGTHATGNGAISLAARIARRDQKTVDYLCGNTCPVDMLDSLKDPVKVVEFFNEVYVNQYWKRFGFMCDWRRFTSTVKPDYQKFIQWQFRKLMEKGLLIQKPYYAPACVTHGPVAIDASETDIQCGGSAETVEYTLLKFKCGDMYLVAATLRPETVFGQTNFWVNPNADYVKVRVGQEIWVVSEDAHFKLTYQMDGVEKIASVKGSELIGLKCLAPMVHREILTLPADFVDPGVGTGLVTSVPSDSPDDWILPPGSAGGRRHSRPLRSGQGRRESDQAHRHHRDEGMVRPSCGRGNRKNGHHLTGRSQAGGGQEAGLQGRFPHRQDERHRRRVRRASGHGGQGPHEADHGRLRRGRGDVRPFGNGHLPLRRAGRH
ncbi:MAG: class I tRNA ligase family protein [Methanomassiliicoccales archaeon]